jgi:hypothetical protein
LDPLVNAYASYAVASGGSSDPAAHSDPTGRNSVACVCVDQGIQSGGVVVSATPPHVWNRKVVNYEVVLANGTVCAANAQQNSDLYWALKGGAFNFGGTTGRNSVACVCVDQGIQSRGVVVSATPPHVWNRKGCQSWGANSVVNYEVVLANGTVCAANAQQNSDLYWALLRMR